MKNLISVVVPVYNVEKYLDGCVESICAQTYDALEIILVDDGATDSSGEMCERLAKQDKRIRVLHKQNGGLSDARNAGMAAATGEYICFFDSDDWVEKDILDKAYKALQQSDAEIAVWGFTKDFADLQECVLKSESVKKTFCICRKEEKNYSCFSDETGLAMLGYAWNKLYKRNLIMDNNLQFEKGVSLVEDILFNEKALSAANTFVFVDTIGNHYMQRQRETLGAKFYPDFFELKMRACKAREVLLTAYGADETEAHRMLENSYFAGIKSSCRMACQSDSLTKKEKRNYMRQICGTPQARKIIKTYHGAGKDVLFRYMFLFRQYWVFEAMYGR